MQIFCKKKIIKSTSTLHPNQCPRCDELPHYDPGYSIEAFVHDPTPGTSNESKYQTLTMDAVYSSASIRVKPAPGYLSAVCRLEERVIHVSGRDKAEHEEAQHNHYLLLHGGTRQETISGWTVVGSVTFGRGRLRRWRGPHAQPVNWLDT